MLAALQPSFEESLPETWAALHKTAHIVVHDCEVHYLTAMALASDDDLVAHLLLKKLRMARRTIGEPDRDIVRMNSYVEFSHGDGIKRFGQLIHPSAPDMPSYGLGVTSLTGAGLIGLRSGQTILWPDADDVLRDLTVVHVENCPGLSKWLETAI